MFGVGSGDQSRGSGAETEFGGGLRSRLLEPGIGCEAKVVVRREGDEGASFKMEVDSGSAIQGLAGSESPAGSQGIQVRGYLVSERWKHGVAM